MFEIAPTSPKLAGLFYTDLPNSPALWAVLKGNYPGRALVDQTTQPVQCVIRTDAALTYFSQGTNQPFLNEALNHFCKIGAVWLVWSNCRNLHPPASRTVKQIHRLEFFDSREDTLTYLREQIPNEFSIRPIDQKLLDRCRWRDEMEFYAGNLENFLRHGIGLCMMKGEEIVVETYASALGKLRAEIGAITMEKYRGQGYAPIACSYLIQECTQRGYQAYWSCDADHVASIQVARKLGFREQRAYSIFEYEQVQ